MQASVFDRPRITRHRPNNDNFVPIRRREGVGDTAESQRSILESFLENLKASAGEEECDFTIVCEERHYKAHKTILRLHSSYFARMFKQGFKETIEGRVTLQGDWEGAVEAVMHYFYNFTYDLQQLTSAMTYNGEQLSKLKAHVLVWVAADKYEIPGLKLRTRRKMQMEMMGVSAGWYEPEPDNTSNALTTNPFMQQVPRFILSQSRVTDLFSVIDFAYNHPKQGADGLRQLFVHIWHSLPRDVRENLPQDAVRDLFQQQPDFAIDIAVTPREDYSSKELIKRIW